VIRYAGVRHRPGPSSSGGVRRHPRPGSHCGPAREIRRTEVGEWVEPSPQHSERFARRFAGQVAPAREALGEDLLPGLRLHDLHHTHATLLLAAGVPVKVVSERLGHASATITLAVYQHVRPGMGREAADRFTALLEG
jgi:integrase